MRRRAGRLALASLLPAVLLLGGCGTPDPDASASGSPSATAAASGTEAGAEAVEAFARTLTSATQTASAEYAGTVTVAGREQAVSGRLTMPDESSDSGDGNVSALLVRTEDADVGRVQLVLLGPTLYYRNPDLPDPAAGRPWVRVDVTEAAPDLAAVLAAVTSVASFGSLTDLAPAVTLDGPVDEIVDGVPARRYQIALDLAAAQASDDPDVAEPGATAADGTTRVVTTYWLDDDGRPLLVEQGAEPPSGSPAGSRLTFSGWGEADPVLPPPDDDVVDGADLA